MSSEGTTVEVTLFDVRVGSPTEGAVAQIRLQADPRISLVIPHGVAYRFSTTTPILVRCEHVVFVDRAEPRGDIPMFNQDLIIRQESALRGGWRLAVPELRCPGKVVYQLARAES